jgi:hypothetical protein
VSRERAIEVMTRYGSDVLAEVRETDPEVDEAAAVLVPGWAIEDWSPLIGAVLLREIGEV